ncbi:MAG: GNAT family N-acetyltransferase [Actinomycetota bacterium]
MQAFEEIFRSGTDYVDAVTRLLQHCRRAHPTKGVYDTGELSWWWAEIPRPTDSLDQLFWYDESGTPVAAVVLIDWRDWVSMNPIVMPDASPEWVAHVVDRGLAHAEAAGLGVVELEIDRHDEAIQGVLADHGFAIKADGFVEAWLDADARPPVSDLVDRYRLAGRDETEHLVHPMAPRHHPEIERRLRETPLYRADLDLAILTDDDEVAAYALCWYDPETSTGLVEPMRTENEHQRQGLARHLLTAGVDRLARVGAARVKIVFEPDNPASSHLYPDVGFQPVKYTDIYAR